MTDRDVPRLREYLIQAALLLVVLAALFPGVFFRGETAIPCGLLFEYAPWKAYAPEGFTPPSNHIPLESLSLFHYWFKTTPQALWSGEWPFWNHLQFAGMPLLANYQSAIFFPLYPFFLVFGVHLATNLYMLGRLWLGGMAAYVYGRQIGLRPTASCMLSIAFAASSFSIHWFYWPLPATFALLPLMLLGVEFALDGRYARGFFTLALGAAFPMLAGHPETTFLGSLGIGMYFFLRLAWERRTGARLWKPVAVAGGAWVVVLLLCAAQVLPFVEYVGHSHSVLEEAGRDQATDRAVPLGGLLALFVPKFFGTSADHNMTIKAINSNFVSMVYPGVAVWLGIALLFARGPRGRAASHARVACLAIPCALFSLTAFNIPGLEILFEFPYVRHIWRSWLITFPMLSLPILGAIGWEHWFSQRRRLVQTLRPALFLIPPLLLVAGVYLFNRKILDLSGHGPYVRLQLAAAAAFAAMGIAAALLHVFGGRARWAGALVCIAIAVDLTFSARNLLPTSPQEHVYFDTRLTDYLQEREQPCRVSVWSAGIPPGLTQRYGIEQLWANDGMFPARMLRFMNELGGRPDVWPRVEPLCSVQYYLFRADSYDPAEADPPHEYVATIDQIHVMRNTRAMPRAFLVGEVEVVPDTETLFDRMRDPGFDPTRVAITEAPPARDLPSAHAADPGTATVVSRAPNRMEVAVDAQADCVLVLSEAFYPGWRATVNGESAEVFPVYHVFRGLTLPPGRHTVILEMRPRSFYIGYAISLLAALAILPVSAWFAFRRSRTP